MVVPLEKLVLALFELSELDVIESGETLNDVDFSIWDDISSLSQRPLKRNLDFWMKSLLELFILGTSAPCLKLFFDK